MVKANNNRTKFLRDILFLKWIVTLLVWGLPALVGPPALFELLGVPFPSDPTFIRLFGAVVTALALAYWYAWKDPVRNVAIIRFGILDNGLATATILFLAFTAGLSSFVQLVFLGIGHSHGVFFRFLHRVHAAVRVRVWVIGGNGATGLLCLTWQCI